MPSLRISWSDERISRGLEAYLNCSVEGFPAPNAEDPVDLDWPGLGAMYFLNGQICVASPARR